MFFFFKYIITLPSDAYCINTFLDLFFVRRNSLRMYFMSETVKKIFYINLANILRGKKIYFRVLSSKSTKIREGKRRKL